MHKSYKFFAVILVLVFICCSFLYSPTLSDAVIFTNAQNNFHIDRKTRIAMLTTPAYFVTECNNSEAVNNCKIINKTNNEKFQIYLNANDEEFRQYIACKIQKILLNNKIVWNKEYVDTFLKRYFNDIYREVQMYSGTSKNIVVKARIVSVSSSFVMYKSRLITYSKTLLGITMAEFDTDVQWSCDGNKILYVVPSTFGKVYGPGWNYIGINRHDQYFRDNHSKFYESVTGDFTFTYWYQFFTRHYYPTIDYVIFANGNLNYNTYGW